MFSLSAIAFAVCAFTAPVPPAIHAFDTLFLNVAEYDTVGLSGPSTRSITPLLRPARGPAANASGKFEPVAYTTPSMPKPLPSDEAHFAISMLVS